MLRCQWRQFELRWMNLYHGTSTYSSGSLNRGNETRQRRPGVCHRCGAVANNRNEQILLELLFIARNRSKDHYNWVLQELGSNQIWCDFKFMWHRKFESPASYYHASYCAVKQVKCMRSFPFVWSQWNTIVIIETSIAWQIKIRERRGPGVISDQWPSDHDCNLLSTISMTIIINIYYICSAWPFTITLF